MTTTQNTLQRAPIRALKASTRNARTHSKQQIDQIARSILEFGFTNPVLVDDELCIIAGHGRVAAAKQLGLDTVPIVRLSHLSEVQKRAYMLADNRLAEKAGWDKEILAIEFEALLSLDFNVEITGFSTADIDLTLDAVAAASTQGSDHPEDQAPPPPPSACSRLGDVWVLGRHRLICGDARDASAYRRLTQSEPADVIFTDPPYNVPIGGHVRTGSNHREFVMGAGEMTSTQFEEFLQATLSAAGDASRDGAIAFVCMDWRHLSEVTNAGRRAFGELKQLCVWAKTNGGMGTFYRSQHELVFVFKVREGPHTNTFELGQHGRYRTNVWSYAGVNSFKAGRSEELSLHSTVKPVALVEDAIKDVSKRNELVLDPFGGSGTTLIAAQKCGRRARLIELDPGYCDVIVQRYQRFVGKPALLEESGETFEATAATRASFTGANHD